MGGVQKGVDPPVRGVDNGYLLLVAEEYYRRKI